jgi:hypothetical protein
MQNKETNPCMRCGQEPRVSSHYCADCAADVDDSIFGTDTKFRRACSSCQRPRRFMRENNRVIRCTHCGSVHEVHAEA